MISEFNDKLLNDNSIDEYDLLKCKSYKDIITLLKNTLSKYTTSINLDDVKVVNYKEKNRYDYKKRIDSTSDSLNATPLVIVNKELSPKHFSKALSSIIDDELRSILDLGTYMHYVFEVYDFKNNNIDELDIDDEKKVYLNNFLKH